MFDRNTIDWILVVAIIISFAGVIGLAVYLRFTLDGTQELNRTLLETNQALRRKVKETQEYLAARDAELLHLDDSVRLTPFEARGWGYTAGTSEEAIQHLRAVLNEPTGRHHKRDDS